MLENNLIGVFGVFILFLIANFAIIFYIHNNKVHYFLFLYKKILLTAIFGL